MEYASAGVEINAGARVALNNLDADPDAVKRGERVSMSLNEFETNLIRYKLAPAPLWRSALEAQFGARDCFATAQR
jgi:hypothetical protein